jgi:hypothetical protein
VQISTPEQTDKRDARRYTNKFRASQLERRESTSSRRFNVCRISLTNDYLFFDDQIFTANEYYFCYEQILKDVGAGVPARAKPNTACQPVPANFR